MVDIVQVAGWLELAGYAIGAVGGALLFMEFFQLPNYVNYDPDYDDYNLDMAPADVRQYTWAGRAGALLISLAFALEFLVVLLR
jgi:hypothetical protein